MKKTENQREFEKQVKRLNRIIKKLEKEGYKVESIPEMQKPERVTKQRIKQLKKITPKMVEAQYGYTISTTGEKVKGIKPEKKEKRRKAERERVERKRAKARARYLTTRAEKIKKRDLISHDYEGYEDAEVIEYINPIEFMKMRIEEIADLTIIDKQITEIVKEGLKNIVDDEANSENYENYVKEHEKEIMEEFGKYTTIPYISDLLEGLEFLIVKIRADGNLQPSDQDLINYYYDYYTGNIW